MLTTDDFGLNDYVFKSSPESCSDQSYSSDFMDVTSDEDFITQLSADLDIPLLLNPGEDELSMLNAFFDKSPEEIMAEITSPSQNTDDFVKEISELCDVNISKCSPESFPNLQSQVKQEVSSGSNSPGSEKSSSPLMVDVKEEVHIKTPPVSPTSIIINTSIKELSGNMIYTQPMQIVTTPHIKLAKPNTKQVPIVPKTTFPIIPVTTTKNNPVLIKKEIKPVVTTTASKIVLLDKTAVTQITTVPTATVPTTVSIPSVIVDPVNRFSLSGNIDPKFFKKQQRKIKNRESASLSRKRKKDYVTSLEEQVKELTTENERLITENAQLKERLAQYEESIPSKSGSKSIKPSLFLCIFLLVVGVNLDLLRNPFSTKHEINLLNNEVPKLPDHHGRNLLWAAEEQERNKTSNFSPFSMCPATINQTESARLLLELERWIGKPADVSTKVTLDKNATTSEKAPRRSQRKRKYKLDSPIVSAYKRYRYKTDQQNLSEEPKNEIQVFSLRPDQIYTEFFEAINRQDDTFYVVSFTDQHMLLPALYHNKTRRPKMSLIMPSMLLNDSVSQTSLIPLMKIDCEVLDTSMIHVKHALIPQHLRTYGNASKQKPSSDNGSSSSDGMNYYKKPYKPYFINKKILKPQKEFFNIN